MTVGPDFVRVTGHEGVPGDPGDSAVFTWGFNGTAVPSPTGLTRVNAEGKDVGPVLGDWLIDKVPALYRYNGTEFVKICDLPRGGKGPQGPSDKTQPHTHVVITPDGTYQDIRDKFVGKQFELAGTEPWSP